MLAAGIWPESQLERLLDSGRLICCEHTGSGYLLTVRHRMITGGRTVCHKPLIVGKAGDLKCGFVVYVQDGELTLECHSWDGEGVPDNIRDLNFEIARLD